MVTQPEHWQSPFATVQPFTCLLLRRSDTAAINDNHSRALCATD